MSSRRCCVAVYADCGTRKVFNKLNKAPNGQEDEDEDNDEAFIRDEIAKRNRRASAPDVAPQADA